MGKKFEFAGFISRDAAEKGADVRIRNDKGEESGLVIRIAGPDAKKRRKVAERIFDARIEAGTVKPMTLSEIDAANLEEAVAATISWQFPEGFDGPECTAENVRKTYVEYPSILQQVISAGKNKALFTKS
ncbi:MULTISPECIES: hypothetical protein [unclassified Brucella]|uniref:hypothetical protein n=1 Tax=unclassified Brucella TaxID=2632610 RepID=UPI0009726B29|nr:MULTISPECIES: hypothetical protein [unclassified Brucella]APX70749.1 hypothetical protein BKD03_16655 [Brucella sp. 09RB8471]MRN76830.1 hypothetical protein [Brucella sp. 10RB9210]